MQFPSAKFENLQNFILENVMTLLIYRKLLCVFSQRAKKYMKQFAVEINLAHILDGYLDDKVDSDVNKDDERVRFLTC